MNNCVCIKRTFWMVMGLGCAWVPKPASAIEVKSAVKNIAKKVSDIFKSKKQKTKEAKEKKEKMLKIEALEEQAVWEELNQETPWILEQQKKAWYKEQEKEFENDVKQDPELMNMVDNSMKSRVHRSIYTNRLAQDLDKNASPMYGRPNTGKDKKVSWEDLGLESDTKQEPQKGNTVQ